MRCATSASLTRRCPGAVGLGERGLLVHHLLEDLLVDAELLQHLLVHVAAVGAAVRLQLRLVGAPELGDA